MNLTRIAEALSNARQDLLDHSHEGPQDVRRIIERNFTSLNQLIAEEAAHESSSAAFDAVAIEDRAFKQAREVVEREYFSIMRQVAKRLRKWIGSDPVGDVQWAVEKLERCSTPSGEITGTVISGLELVGGHHRLEALKQAFSPGKLEVKIEFIPRKENEELKGLRRMVRILGERRDAWRKRFEDLKARTITVSHRVIKPKGLRFLSAEEFDRRGQVIADLTRELAEVQKKIEPMKVALSLARQAGRWYGWHDGTRYADRKCLEAQTIDAVEAALK